MLIAENILLALNSIMSNKMRAFLTMLGIIIGIGSVISILTVGNSLTLTVENNMQSMGSKDIFVTVNERTDKDGTESIIDGVKYPESEVSRKDMTDSDYITGDMIRDLSDKFKDQIYAINVTKQVGKGEASYASKDMDISVTAVSAGHFLTNAVKIKEGSMFSANDFGNTRNVCLVDDKMVEKLFDGKPENALGKEVEFDIEDAKPTTFTIVGVYEAEENPGMSSMTSMISMLMPGARIYIPLKSGMQLTNSKDQYSNFRVSTNLGADTEQLAKEITNYFKPLYSGNANYEVTAVTFEGMLDSLTSLMDTLTLAV